MLPFYFPWKHKKSSGFLMVSRGTKEEYYKPGQNMLHKVKNYSKTGQDFKNVISNFACFPTAIVNG